MSERKVSTVPAVTEGCSVSYNVNGCRNGLGGHAGVLIAGLVAKLGLDQMVACCSHDARLDDEFASVDVELGFRVDRQGEVRASRVNSRFKTNTRAVGNGE